MSAIKEHMTPLPHSIGHDIAVGKALEMMREHKCHHLPVLDGGQLVGVISDRDLRLAESVAKGNDTAVEIIMTDEPQVVDPEMDVNEAMKLMMKERIGSLIVRAKDGQPWGIFTATDALNVLS